MTSHEVDGFQISNGKPAPVRKYDLKAMMYVTLSGLPETSWFVWGRTPQGYDFWEEQELRGLTDKGRHALAEMAKQYAQQMEQEKDK